MSSRHLLSLLFLLSTIVPLGVSAATAVKVKVLETVKIHESHKYGYFPSIHMLSTGELICDFSLDGDKHDAEGGFWGYVISNDKGKTWGMRNTAGFIFREVAFTRDPALPDGSLMMLGGYPLPSAGDDYRNINASSVSIGNGGKTITLSRDVVVSLPKPAARHKMSDTVENFASLGPGKIKEAAFMFFSGTTVSSQDGGWLALMYGKLEGDEFFRTIVVKADRSGKKWQYVSTVAGDEAARESLKAEGEVGTEGFTEPNMIRLKDGRLFMALRRGSDNQMYKSWSTDDGKSWSKPSSLGFKGVKPAMMEMSNGLVVVSTGRPGPIGVHVSEDAGKTWGHFTPVADYAVRQKAEAATALNEGHPHRRQSSTCYTGLVEVEPGKLLVVYDHLPYAEGWGLNPADKPEAMNSIYGTFLQFSR